MRRILTLVGILLLCLVQHGVAKTLYVKQGGVDTGLCETAGSPCGTFNFVFPKAVAGDTINLDTTGGVFTQTLRFNLNFTAQNGSAGNVITFQGKDGITAEIRPSSGVEVVTFRNVRYWTMKNIRVDGRNMVGGASTTNGIVVTSSTYGSATDSRNITIEDVDIVDIRNPTGSNSLGISPSGDDITITRMSVNGTHLAAGDNEGSHCLYQAQGNRITIQNSVFQNCGGFGIQLNDSGNVGAGDGVAENTGAVIKYNRIFDNGKRSSGSRGGITIYHHHINSQIYGNLIYSNDAGPGFLVEGSGSSGHQIWHNSIVSNIGECGHFGTDVSHPTTLMSFRNNICEANGNGANFDDFSSNSTITHNVFSDNTGMVNTGTGNTLSDNLTSDPLLVNVGAQDYHLQSGSPARNTGVAVGIVLDFDGVSYGSPPSRGAFEFGGAPPVVTIGFRRVVVY